MPKEATKQTLLEKLKSIYQTIDHIEKRGTNKSQHYKYVKAADLIHAVRNAFFELNIYAEVNFEPVNSFDFKTSSGTQMLGSTVRCTITFHDVDDPTATKYTASGIGTGADTTDKQAYKAQTGALKYALRNAFLVPDEADPENDGGDEVEEEPEPEPETRKPKQTPRQPKQDTEETRAYNKEELQAAAETKPVKGGDEVPPEDEKEGLRNRYELLGKDLASAGLTSKGMKQSAKRLAYLLKVTGADDPKNITRNQWNLFFDVVSKIKSGPGIKELVRLVEEAATESQQQ